MRSQTIDFVNKFFETHRKDGKVLEVGSLDVNGSINRCFDGMEYIGVDIRAGKGVDLVLNGHDLVEHFGDEQFDMVVCFDTFEHDDRFWETLDNMRRVLKPGGYLLLGVPGRNCELHEYPDDYYRFLPSSMKVFLDGYKDTYIEAQRDDPSHSTEDEIYGWGRKV